MNRVCVCNEYTYARIECVCTNKKRRCLTYLADLDLQNACLLRACVSVINVRTCVYGAYVRIWCVRAYLTLLILMRSAGACSVYVGDTVGVCVCVCVMNVHTHVCTRVYVCIYSHCKTLQDTARHCNTLQDTATHCNTLHHTATHCNTLQHTATHCNTLQHTATHCNTRVYVHI